MVLTVSFGTDLGVRCVATCKLWALECFRMLRPQPSGRYQDPGETDLVRVVGWHGDLDDGRQRLSLDLSEASGEGQRLRNRIGNICLSTEEVEGCRHYYYTYW